MDVCIYKNESLFLYSRNYCSIVNQLYLKKLEKMKKIKTKYKTYFFCAYYLFVCLFAISRATFAAYGGSQARGLIRAVATGLRQSHSNTTEQGQGSNPKPHGS